MICIITKEQAAYIENEIKKNEENGLAQSESLSYGTYGINGKTMQMSYLVAVELGNDTFKTIKDRSEGSGKIISGAYLRKKIENIMNMRMNHDYDKHSL